MSRVNTEFLDIVISSVERSTFPAKFMEIINTMSGQPSRYSIQLISAWKVQIIHNMSSFYVYYTAVIIISVKMLEIELSNRKFFLCPVGLELRTFWIFKRIWWGDNFRDAGSLPMYSWSTTKMSSPPWWGDCVFLNLAKNSGDGRLFSW